MMAGAAAWVALGSNLGDREAMLASARSRLAADPGVRSLRAGAIEETAPLGGLSQPSYLNQMAVLETTLTPERLLEVLQRIESDAGRVRADRWASRTLDLDLVRFDGVMCDLPHLILPHPGLRDRTFWATGIAALEAHD